MERDEGLPRVGQAIPLNHWGKMFGESPSEINVSQQCYGSAHRARSATHEEARLKLCTTGPTNNRKTKLVKDQASLTTCAVFGLNLTPPQVRMVLEASRHTCPATGDGLDEILPVIRGSTCTLSTSPSRDSHIATTQRSPTRIWTTSPDSRFGWRDGATAHLRYKTAGMRSE